MFFLAAVTAGLLAGTTSSAYGQGRHYSGYGYAPSYDYSAGDRSNRTNTNGF